MRALGRTTNVLPTGELDEIARFLWFSRVIGTIPGRGIPIYPVTAMCFEHAGITARTPDPDLALRYIESLRLGEIRGKHLMLSRGGEHISQLTRSPVELSQCQRDFLIGLISSDPKLREDFRRFLRHFRRTEDGSLHLTGTWAGDPSVIHFAQLFQQLGLVKARGGSLVLEESKLALISASETRRIPLTPQAFKRALEAQNEIGNAGERFAVEWERARLRATGSQNLEQSVIHVAEFDVGRGYDIRSVDGGSIPDEDRYIEVKSSVNPEIRIHLSDHELEVGRELGERYWIYFIPLVPSLPRTMLRPILFQNPFGCGQALFDVLPESYEGGLPPDLKLESLAIPADDLASGIQLVRSKRSVQVQARRKKKARARS